MVKKKIIAVILALLVLVTLTSCDKDTSEIGAKVVDSEEGYVVIEATAALGSLWDALEYLSGAGELTYDGSESEYGFYITSVNGREADASANEYWAIYTTLGEYEGVAYSGFEYAAFEYDNQKLGSALYGVSGLPMIEGELYALVLETY